MISDILLFVPSVLLILFFRRIRRYRPLYQISPIFQVLSQFRSTTISTTNHVRKTKKKKNAVSFPWWCLFIAYGLSFLIISISILLIIARGIEFGDVKIQQWLGSLMINFFTSVLLSQPIKVCLLPKIRPFFSLM